MNVALITIISLVSLIRYHIFGDRHGMEVTNMAARMSLTTQDRELVSVDASLVAGIEQVTRAGPGLVNASGDITPLPASVYQLLCEITPRLLRGEVVSLVPAKKVLSTRQAAELLGVSRPFLTKLLDQGAMPYHAVGTHRRVYLADVLAYRTQRDGDRRKLVDEIVRLSEDLGAYD
jgi:excisionase family DNA binding protein